MQEVEAAEESIGKKMRGRWGVRHLVDGVELGYRDSIRTLKEPCCAVRLRRSPGKVRLVCLLADRPSVMRFATPGGQRESSQLVLP